MVSSLERLTTAFGDRYLIEPEIGQGGTQARGRGVDSR
jgi:hypothetical protein